MSDWIKVLIGALAGMVTGLAAEPLKQQLSIVVDSWRIQSALFDELSAIYVTFCSVRKHADTWTETDLRDNLKFCSVDRFVYYFEKKREACYRLKGWAWARGFLTQYQDIRENALRDMLSPEKVAHAIKRAFLEHARLGEDEESLLNQVEKHFEKHGIAKLAPEDVPSSR